ncbi:MAG: hypothetical protein PHZ26_03250 [Candidatus Gracilibacteria bacterium]|nr:hypothetical protein [Candidatus Gracilibacteria bacterium]MDD2908744.1 hypothetical protein [Candidatus Gracilibacteria bacterium]
MRRENVDYMKIRKNLQDTLKNLLDEKLKEKETLISSTRFEIKNKVNADKVLKKVDLKGKEEYYLLRKKWSYYIFASLAGTILFQFFLTGFLIYGVTHSIFPFSDVYNLFFLIVGENFAQIIGLSYVIVRFLFSPEK